MRRLRELFARLSARLRGPQMDRELDEEIASHLAEAAEESVARGLPPEEARLAALRGFGGVMQTRERHRDLRSFAWLDDLRQDLRYARRTMAARPGFAAVAILSLALGIGANTAIFSLWHAVLRASLPAVHQPEQLVMLSNPDEAGMWSGRADGVRSWLTYAEFEALRDHADRFSAVMASQSDINAWPVRVEGGEREEVTWRLVSGGFFRVLGVDPAIGRLFTADEDRAESPVAVISHRYWERRFSGRADVLGKTVTLGAVPLTIVGVAPPRFIGETVGQQPDFWLPMRMQPRVLPGTDRLHDTPPAKVMWLHVFGRLRPGVSLAQADAQANAIFRAGLESFYGTAAPDERRRVLMDQRLHVQPAARGASPRRREFSQSLTALLVAVGVLLLIACANLANLLLARGAARKPEIALRLSLGAGRGRLVRQLVTESLALSALGGLAAFAVAYVLHGALVRMLAESDPLFRMSFTADPTLFAFILVATVGAALVFGLFPAWQTTRGGAASNLLSPSRGVVGTLGQLRSGRFLVSVQLALSLPLLVGAGLLVQTVYNLQRADLGFAPERVLLVRVNVPAAVDNAQRSRLLHELAGQFEAIPGVRAASFSRLGVFSGGESTHTVEAEGDTPRRDADRESGADVIGPDYFSTLGVKMLLGREIVEGDSAAAPRVCVINEAFAERFFDTRNPIGLRVTRTDDGNGTSCQVVGVARNTRTASLRGDVGPRYFVAALQPPASIASPTFLIRTATATVPVIADVRKTIARVGAGVSVASASSIEQEMAPLTAQDRTTARLAVVFGGVALTLAAIGLYGVLSYGVARRTGEIAIRLALGAQSGRVISMILGETIGLVGAGLALGGSLAYASSRVIDSRLYGVAPQDPLTLVSATALLLVVALTAAYVPARRASRLDPMAALRQQ